MAPISALRKSCTYDWLSFRFAQLVALIQAVTAMMWMAAGTSHVSGQTYTPVNQLLSWLPAPVYWWSGLLLLCAVGALYAIWKRKDLLARVCYSVMTGFWVFWSIIYIVALFTQPTAGAAAFGLALIAAVGNARPTVGLPFLSEE